MNSSFNSGSRRNQEGSSKVTIMKRLLGLTGLAIALSGCLIIVETSLQFTSANFTGAFSYEEAGVVNEYTCTDRSILVELKFRWSGDLAQYAIEFYGQNNPTPPSAEPYPRYPATGFFQVSGRLGVDPVAKTATEVLNYSVDQVHPLRDEVRTQAVIVTPKPSGQPLGATLIRIIGRDSTGNQFTYNVPGKILVYGDGNCPS
jgi:hypothetical protein